jgi:hypothetical protein
MGQMDPAKLPRNFDMVSYWSAWSISLLVTASNGFLQLFSLDKNYFSYSMVVEQLKTEGWQFFGLSGKYEDYPTHQDAYKTFSKSVESIKRKQVEQEFSNGKGENKKKKFNFKGEMQKFSQEQEANLEFVNTGVTNQIQSKIKDTIIEKSIETIKDSTKVPEKITEEVQEKVDNIVQEEKK